jgi:type I restriction enzyme S subunit
MSAKAKADPTPRARHSGGLQTPNGESSQNPEPWATDSIGELFDIGAGKSVTPPARAGARSHPFLRTSNVFWGRIDVSDVSTMHFSDDEIETKALRKGDLLVCEGGDIGRSAIWNGELEQCGFQNHLHRLRAKHEDIVPLFVMYYLQAGFTQLGIYEGAGNKTTIPNISRSRLAALKVPIPPKPEQQKIAAVLWKMQRAIATQDRLIAATRDLKQSAMQRLFTHGLRDEPPKDTAIGPMPKSWSPRTLLELCAIQSGGTPRKSNVEYWKGNIPWVSGKDLKAVSLNDAIDHVSPEGVAAGSRLAPTGSVLLLVRGMGLAKDLPVAVITRPMAFNQDLKALVPRGEFSGEFLRSAIYVGKERLLERIVASAHGTMTLNLDDVETLSVACPSDPAEANDIAAALATIDRKLAHHQQKRAALHDLFQTTLHQLMTALIRVADLDIDTAEVAGHFPDAGNMIDGATQNHVANAGGMVRPTQGEQGC